MASRKRRATWIFVSPPTREKLARWDRFHRTAGATLKHFRKAAGMTQRELSEASGVSLAIYGRNERGERSTLLRELEQLCGALKISGQAFFAEHSRRFRR